MTSTIPQMGAQAADPLALASTRGVPFQRIAGTAGLLAFAIGVMQMVAVGGTPGLGASAADVVGYYATNGDAHRFGVVAAALLGIPIALYMIGIHRTLSAADRATGSSWSTLFLFGAIMMSVTAGLAEASSLFSPSVEVPASTPIPFER